MADPTIRELFRVPPTNGLVGIEIEIEGMNIPLPSFPRSNWKGEVDHSLRGESLEYVLRSPLPYAAAVDQVYRLKHFLEESNAVIEETGRSGVHVHINCQNLTEKELYKFIVLYLIVEPLLVHWCGTDREGNLFCLRSSDAEGLIHMLISARLKGSIRYISGLHLEDQYRYAALNMAALVKYGSLEFRSMRTPADLKEVITWISFIVQVYEAAAKYESAGAILEAFSGEGVDRMLGNIFGGAEELLLYPNCDDDVYEAIRRVQYLVYIEAVPQDDMQMVGLDPWPDSIGVLKLRPVKKMRIKAQQKPDQDKEFWDLADPLINEEAERD